MVRLFNPVTNKYEEVDDYHYFDVKGRFPGTKLDWKELLMTEYQGTCDYVRVETKQGSKVWIDLENTNPGTWSNFAGSKFWGTKTPESESGWYFDYDDIENVIGVK